MELFRIFIVEDDPWYGELIEYHLAYKPDHEIHRFATGTECLLNLYKKPDLVSIDYSLPDMNGVDLLRGIREYSTEIPVIVISAQEDVSTAVTLLKKGATDYFFKNDNTKELLWNAVNRIKENQFLKNEVEHLKEELSEKYKFARAILGSSLPMQKVFGQLEKAAASDVNVCIQGETGTGKEVAAKAIHYNSRFMKKPFVAVPLAAVPHDMVESELFGYEKGAFTGAFGTKTGKIEDAHTGTLFLDEIAGLDLHLQARLLEALETSELKRQGGTEVIKFDVRLVVSAHQDLLGEVAKGNFRADLFYRIMGMPVELPPLRDRGGDILLLADHFLTEYCHQNKLGAKTFSPAAQEKLMTYYYPGNVRELKAIVEFAAIVADGPMINEGDIFFANMPPDEFFFSEEKTMKEYTTEIIRHYLKKYENNVIKVADKLHIGKSAIYKLMQDNEQQNKG